MASRSEIIRGQTKTLYALLKYKDSKEPLDLSTASEINAYFDKDDGSILDLTKTTGEITIVSAAGGKIKIVISSANTLLMKEDERQDWEVKVTLAGPIVHKVQFLESLDVLKSKEEDA